MDSPETAQADSGIAEKLLQRLNSRKLEALRESLNSRESESERITLGGALPSSDASTLSEWRKAALYMRAALEEAIAACGPRIKEITVAQTVANRWQCASEIIAVIGPASIFGVLRVDHPKPAEYLSAGFALLALIVGVAAGFASRLPTAGGTLLERYHELVEIKSQASAILREVNVWLKRSNIGPAQEDLLAQANDVCRRADMAIF